MAKEDYEDIQKLAEKVLGSREKADIWLSKPRSQFGGKSALECLANGRQGYKQVVEALGQIDSGYFT